jgi:1,4-dihydroxy-2-naphthoyl-CoA hydrolase
MIPDNISLQQLNEQSRQTMAEHIGIVYTGVGRDWIEAEMPVDYRTHQPYGILHGGASVVLAETLGSVGSHLIVAESGNLVMGLEVNANHIRRVSIGKVTGRATIIHAGKSTHIWEIRITDEATILICIARLTVIILKPELK